MQDIEQVAVIGGGTMGNGIAHVFAQHGYNVVLVDVGEDRLARAIETIGANMDRQVRKGALTAEAKEAAIARLRPATELSATSDAQLVVEAVPENLEMKLELFRELDQHTRPEAILASNTSSISITALAGATRRPEQVIGMHFMNPVPVMQLVEVIRGLATSDATTHAVLDLARRVGKTPVEVNDYPGFV